jgi:PEP-CTERM motif
MVFKNASRVVGALASIFLLHGAASAATVAGPGQFNVTGTVFLTNTAFEIGFHSVPTASSADETAAVVLPTTGVFSDLTAGELVGMKNLLTPNNTSPLGPGPVVPGGSFTLTQFLTLPDGIDADLTGLPLSSAPSVCSGTSFNAPGSVCQAQAGSPITLEQGTDGVTAIFNLSGRAYIAGTTNFVPLTGKFSANFSQAPDNTISGLLNDFTTHGFITTGFAANFSTGSAVPEPSSMALLGASLFGLGLLGKKKLVKK